MDILDVALLAFAVILALVFGCYTVVKGIRGLLMRRITPGGLRAREMIGGYAVVMSITYIVVGLLFLAMLMRVTLRLFGRSW